MRYGRPATGQTNLYACGHANGFGWPEGTDRRLGAATSRASQSGQQCIAPYRAGLRQKARRALLGVGIRGSQDCRISSLLHGGQIIADGTSVGWRSVSTLPSSDSRKARHERGWRLGTGGCAEDGRVRDAAPTQDEDAACAARVSQSRRLDLAGSGQGSGASAGARLADGVTALGDRALGTHKGHPYRSGRAWE